MGEVYLCFCLFFPTAPLPVVKAVPGFEQALNKCVEHWTQDINKICIQWQNEDTSTLFYVKKLRNGKRLKKLQIPEHLKSQKTQNDQEGVPWEERI